MKHNSGEWNVLHNTQAGPGGMTLPAGTFIVSGKEDIAYIPVDQKHNANIIAAAPNMLKALIKAKNWMDHDFDKKMTEHDAAVYDETMEAINNAIKKSNTMKHTPGPYKAIKCVTQGEFVTETRIVSKDASVLATLGPCDVDNNASLFAAAPELFDAVRSLLKWVDKYDIPTEILHQARTAIKKATNP